MMDTLVNTLELFPKGLIFIALGITVLVIAKLLQEFITPYKISEQLSKKNNAALGLSIAGYYLGVIIIYVAVIYQPLTSSTVGGSSEGALKFEGDYWLEVLEAFLFALGAVVVLNVSRWLVDKFVLFKFDTAQKIVEEQNVGSGAVEFGVYVAVSLVIAASTASTGGEQLGTVEVSLLEELLRTVAFFGLGMVALISYTIFYELTTKFSIHDEIQNNNTAVGVALAGNLVAVSIVTFKAVYGGFTGWTESLVAFVIFAVLGFALLYAIRWVVDMTLLPGTKVSDELAVDRNLGVAFIESTVVISAALILYFAV
tara:strand:+ start:76 stop:1014 length:939 start_codon:yes stop_codon:yes gene_type:complete